ncbi:dihydrolipoyl dehydrogenase [Paenibacillus baekrokdamisoli]|uniref:Dihydrolipoyl dehydrogenase n=1 Tax=Paenibacillus baekrokdamisoli TaxID=1712516 RepID=A0A3G9JB55_9BACL|nr:dihydrolipoyl dehydrogenase [Paenibacillus baekrokdamisoli]MBB3069565.1 dihydrolipoamide dehydrogenase [Paenibacillus baekrokdamisoli]BBH21078.1 dihydrolipoyl dehydrogenase [Paenibacillus baekrokdamisoli]
MTTTIPCDLAIIGGGIAGYTAAIKAAKAGKKVILIEKEKLGGTCLHKGCIPSKALLRSAEVFATLKNAASFGIKVEENAISIDFEGVQQRKVQTVEQLYKGLQYLMRKHEITIMNGSGRVIGPSIFSPRSGSVAVELADGEMETIVPTNLFIATGSRPRTLPGLEPDGQYIMSSDDALRMEQLPASILIVGGGVIGVEWASMLIDFGVEVTLVEMASRLLPGEDAESSAELAKQLRRRGVRILTSIQLKVETYAQEEGQVSIEVDTADGSVILTAERMLVSVGRQANAENIGLENTDVRVEKGNIQVNGFFQTTEPHIYAIGDVNGGLQLAHAAAHEAIVAVEHLLGGKQQAPDPVSVPRAIYSRPEVASIGLTEDEARKRGHDVKVGKVPFQAIGKALVLGEPEGFAKVIADTKTNDILGVHLIGPHATDLLSEASLAMLLNAAPWEVGQVIHPHPTLSEVIGEAMLAVDGQSIAF